jgi:hypothetical protein
MTAWVIAEHVLKEKTTPLISPSLSNCMITDFFFLYISKLYKSKWASVYNLEANDVWQQHKQPVYNLINILCSVFP